MAIIGAAAIYSTILTKDMSEVDNFIGIGRVTPSALPSPAPTVAPTPAAPAPAPVATSPAPSSLPAPVRPDVRVIPVVTAPPRVPAPAPPVETPVVVPPVVTPPVVTPPVEEPPPVEPTGRTGRVLSVHDGATLNVHWMTTDPTTKVVVHGLQDIPRDNSCTARAAIRALDELAKGRLAEFTVVDGVAESDADGRLVRAVTVDGQDLAALVLERVTPACENPEPPLPDEPSDPDPVVPPEDPVVTPEDPAPPSGDDPGPQDPDPVPPVTDPVPPVEVPLLPVADPVPPAAGDAEEPPTAQVGDPLSDAAH